MKVPFVRLVGQGKKSRFIVLVFELIVEDETNL